MATTGRVGGAIPFCTFDRDTNVKYHPYQARFQGLSKALMSLEERQHKHQDRTAHVHNPKESFLSYLKSQQWQRLEDGKKKKVATTVNITHTYTQPTWEKRKEMGAIESTKDRRAGGAELQFALGNQARGPSSAALQAPLRRRSPHDPRQPLSAASSPGGPGPRERSREKKGLRTPCPYALLPSDGELPRDSQDGAQGG